MTTFYTKKKDTSKENISQAASFLNKKPKHQGSNQRLEDVKLPEKK